MAKSTARRGAREPLPTGVALRAVRYSAPEPPDETYPFSLPILANLDELPFPTPITFLVGENGSGKSSLLEAIAVGADLQTLGGQDTRRDPTLADARRLAAALR
nr:AAA family ATPase [Chloroflexia bacterium]